VIATSTRSSSHFVFITGYKGDGLDWPDFEYLDPWDQNLESRHIGDPWVKQGAGTRVFQ
jgi:hypothetical protein